jgi:hypothetical protein
MKENLYKKMNEFKEMEKEMYKKMNEFKESTNS